MRQMLLVLTCLVLTAAVAPAEEAKAPDPIVYWEQLFTLPRLGDWSSDRSFLGPSHPYPEFVTAPTPEVAERRFLIWRPGDDAANRPYAHWKGLEEGTTVHRQVILVEVTPLGEEGRWKLGEKKITRDELEAAKTVAEAAAILGGAEVEEELTVLAGKKDDAVTVRHVEADRLVVFRNLEKTWKPFTLVKRDDYTPENRPPTWRTAHVRKAKPGAASVQVQMLRSAKEVFWTKAWIRGGNYDSEYSGSSLVGGDESILATDKETGSRVASARYFNRKGAPTTITMDFGAKHRVDWRKRPGSPVVPVGEEKIVTTVDELKFQEKRGRTLYVYWWSPKVPGAVVRSLSVEEKKGKFRLRLSYVTKFEKAE